MKLQMKTKTKRYRKTMIKKIIPPRKTNKTTHISKQTNKQKPHTICRCCFAGTENASILY